MAKNKGKRIRSLEVKDLDTVGVVEALCFPGEAWPVSYFEFLLQTGSKSSVAEQHGSVVGFIFFKHEADEAAVHVADVAVLPIARGRGYGYLLVQEAFAEARTLDLRFVLLEVDVDNKSALHLYRRMGFEVIGTEKNYYPSGNDAFVMRAVV